MDGQTQLIAGIARALARSALLFAAAVSVVQAAEPARTPRPVIVIDKPGACVADAATMRRDHMNLLLHQRDQTMRLGIRTTRYSLNACIECHASVKTGSVLGAGGFCESCHSYAGVRLDCFECHQARPGPAPAHPSAARSDSPRAPRAAPRRDDAGARP